MTAWRKQVEGVRRRSLNAVEREPPRANSASESSRCRVGAGCLCCDAHYDDAGWKALAFIARIAPGSVREIVRRWPDDRALEVRRCTACGREVVRRVEA
jgi:hypothetical protein